MIVSTSKLNSIIDYIGISLIGLFSFAYCSFEITFAELNVQLFSLDFPIFIGEILFFACCILFLIKCIVNFNFQKLSFWHYFIFIYLGFVLAKALLGYLSWGPLALRHSALFYYPLFAVFSYSFFSKEFFKNRKLIIVVLILLYSASYFTLNTSYKFICLIMAIVLINTYPRGFIKYLLLFSFIALVPYKSLFLGKRTMWISNFVSIFFIVIMATLILKARKSYRLILCGILLIGLTVGLIGVMDKHSLLSIINLKDNIKQFRGFHDRIQSRKDQFAMVKLGKPRLYNKDNYGLFEDKQIKPSSNELQNKQNNKILVQPQLILVQPQLIQQPQQQMHPAIAKQFPEQKAKLEAQLDTAYSNNSFRLLIWMDLIEELWIRKPVFGFDFGKPFRSKNIEILNFALSEWGRDGWISSHNSYLEIIYRAGIVGILLMITTFLILRRMIIITIASRSMNGVLLCGALVSWLISANFMPVLELPYKAIPFWCLFGMVFSYLKAKERAIISKPVNKG